MKATNYIGLAALLLFVFLLGYAALIEPNWLEISRYELQGNVERPLKLTHLSDFHFGRFGNIESKVLKAILEEAPDVILITGDMLQDSRGIGTARKLFGELHPPLGIWAVLGNWENWQQVGLKELFRSFNVNLLINESTPIRKDVTLVGFDDSFSGKPDRRLAHENSPEFCIAMIHSPAFFETTKSTCPLTLAGHTHGGQIRLPLIGALWLPPESGNYVSGWYGPLGAKMYVSRGIGTSILPLRFLARPEVVFITIRSSR